MEYLKTSIPLLFEKGIALYKIRNLEYLLDIKEIEYGASSSDEKRNKKDALKELYVDYNRLIDEDFRISEKYIDALRSFNRSKHKEKIE